MGFEESALARLRRYREEADVSLELVREVETMARRFFGRISAGLEYTAVLGRQAGFEIETFESFHPPIAFSRLTPHVQGSATVRLAA